MDNSQIRSRKWLITQENPEQYGLTHDYICTNITKIKNLRYWCMCDEVGGKTGTYHTHIFIYRDNDIKFTTLQKIFPHAHFDKCRGSCAENRDYIKKTGKFVNTDKQETNLPDTFFESGEIPDDSHQGQRNDLTSLYNLIADGASDSEILSDSPEFAKHIDKFERIRQVCKESQYKDEFRHLDIHYISGPTGTGKTRTVMEKYGYSNVYRVTDYSHPFDSYAGEDVILFEEFRSSLKIQEMLIYLDGYPVKLPCRYINRQACYTQVYIISNIGLEDQYSKIQQDSPETWKAFLRRINHLHYYVFNEYAELSNFEQLKLNM